MGLENVGLQSTDNFFIHNFFVPLNTWYMQKEGDMGVEVNSW